MKISLSDRYEALRRNRKYCKDWEKWQQAEAKAIDDKFRAITKKLKSKYHVPRVPTPLRCSSYSRLQVKPKPIEVIPFIDPKERGSESLGSRGRRRTMTEDMKALRKKQTVTLDDFLEDGRYLHLKIDIQEPLPNMESAFRDIVKDWKARLPKNGKKERLGKTSLDPWYVYDLHTLFGKSLLVIAKELIGIDKNPAYNSRVDAQYRQVKWAFEKAKKMIQSIPEDK